VFPPNCHGHGSTRWCTSTSDCPWAHARSIQWPHLCLLPMPDIDGVAPHARCVLQVARVQEDAAVACRARSRQHAVRARHPTGAARIQLGEPCVTHNGKTLRAAPASSSCKLVGVVNGMARCVCASTRQAWTPGLPAPLNCSCTSRDMLGMVARSERVPEGEPPDLLTAASAMPAAYTLRDTHVTFSTWDTAAPCAPYSRHTATQASALVRHSILQVHY